MQRVDPEAETVFRLADDGFRAFHVPAGHRPDEGDLAFVRAVEVLRTRFGFGAFGVRARSRDHVFGDEVGGRTVARDGHRNHFGSGIGKGDYRVARYVESLEVA